MPKSKRSAKRRAKLRKRNKNTYDWALRKVNQMSEEDLERFASSLKTTGWKAQQPIEEVATDDLQG